MSQEKNGFINWRNFLYVLFSTIGIIVIVFSRTFAEFNEHEKEDQLRAERLTKVESRADALTASLGDVKEYSRELSKDVKEANKKLEEIDKQLDYLIKVWQK